MYVHVNVYRHGLQTRRFNPCHKFLVDSCSGVYAYVNESMYAYVHVNLSVVYASVNVNINMYNVLIWFNFCDIYFVDSCSQNLVYVYVWMYTCMHMFTSIYMYTVLHDSVIHETWVIYMNAMTHSYLWNDVFMYTSTESLLCSSIWYGVATISRLLQIIRLFAEYRLFYRALLQKRPIIWRSLLIVATPYCPWHLLAVWYCPRHLLHVGTYRLYIYVK